METLFPEQLLHSAHRTTDPEQADFFYVPVFDGCALALHHHNKRAYDRFPSGKRYARGMVMQEEALQFIRTKYPYWNRTYGRDHLFLAVADEARALIALVRSSRVFLDTFARCAKSSRVSLRPGMSRHDRGSPVKR